MNKYAPTEDPNVLRLELTQGKTALIDKADLELVSQHRWCTFKTRSGTKAGTSVKTPTGRKTLYLHRFLMRT